MSDWNSKTIKTLLSEKIGIPMKYLSVTKDGIMAYRVRINGVGFGSIHKSIGRTKEGKYVLIIENSINDFVESVNKRKGNVYHYGNILSAEEFLEPLILEYKLNLLTRG
jgi:hypothetical protein